MTWESTSFGDCEFMIVKVCIKFDLEIKTIVVIILVGKRIFVNVCQISIEVDSIFV